MGIELFWKDQWLFFSCGYSMKLFECWRLKKISFATQYSPRKKTNKQLDTKWGVKKRVEAMSIDVAH